MYSNEYERTENGERALCIASIGFLWGLLFLRRPTTSNGVQLYMLYLASCWRPLLWRPRRCTHVHTRSSPLPHAPMPIMLALAARPKRVLYAGGVSGRCACKLSRAYSASRRLRRPLSRIDCASRARGTGHAPRSDDHLPRSTPGKNAGKPPPTSSPNPRRFCGVCGGQTCGSGALGRG